MSTGVLTVVDVEGIHAGRIADPLMSQIAALGLLVLFGVLVERSHSVHKGLSREPKPG